MVGHVCAHVHGSGKSAKWWPSESNCCKLGGPVVLLRQENLASTGLKQGNSVSGFGWVGAISWAAGAQARRVANRGLQACEAASTQPPVQRPQLHNAGSPAGSPPCGDEAGTPLHIGATLLKPSGLTRKEGRSC